MRELQAITNRQEAMNILNPLSRCTIADTYDRLHGVEEAILCLMPNFEYPDWDYKTISQFLCQVKLNATGGCSECGSLATGYNGLCWRCDDVREASKLGRMF